MPLNIEANWSKPISLINGPELGYTCQSLEKFPESPGVYVFIRQFGDNVEPLYIGKAMNIRRRIKQQLDSVKLMSKIKNAGTGAKSIIYCTPTPKRAQSASTVIGVLEDALIAYALAEGHKLLQKQGTLRPSHEIKLSGNRISEKIAGRLIRLRAK